MTTATAALFLIKTFCPNSGPNYAGFYVDVVHSDASCPSARKGRRVECPWATAASCQTCLGGKLINTTKGYIRLFVSPATTSHTRRVPVEVPVRFIVEVAGVAGHDVRHQTFLDRDEARAVCNAAFRAAKAEGQRTWESRL